MAYASERHDWFAGVTNAPVASQGARQTRLSPARRGRDLVMGGEFGRKER